MNRLTKEEKEYWETALCTVIVCRERGEPVPKHLRSIEQWFVDYNDLMKQRTKLVLDLIETEKERNNG